MPEGRQDIQRRKKISKTRKIRKTIPIQKLADDVYELSLAQGDEVLLYDAAQPPEPAIRPIPTDSAAHNPYGVRLAK